MKKILIHTSGQLGDILVLFPIFAAIRQQNPEAHITVLNKHDTNASTSPIELTRSAGYADEIILTSRNKLRWWRFLSFFPGLHKKYDEAYWLVRDSKILPNKIRRERAFFQRLSKTPVNGMVSLQPLVGSHQRSPHVMEMIAARINVTTPLKLGTHLFPLKDTERESAREYLKQKGVPPNARPFAVCIGGKKSLALWPIDKYIETLQKITAETNALPVFFGGLQDRANIKRIQAALPAGKSFFAEEFSTDLRKSIAVMSQLCFYLGNDTGSLHMAAAAGLRCVCISHSSDFAGRWDPLGSGHKVMRCKEFLECEACRETICKFGTPAKCIDSITVNDVYHSVQEMLGII